MTGSKVWLVACGAALILIGVLIRRWAARYDLREAAIDSAWTLVRRKRTAENPTALEAKFNEIRSQPTWRRTATKAAGTAAGHFAAQVFGVIALVLILVGLALAVYGFFWA